MSFIESVVLVFIAGLITALATGIGAFPFFFVDDFSDRWNVALWGIASGIMVAASIFGLVNEGLAASVGGFPSLMVGGILSGIILVEVSDTVLDAVGLSNDTAHEHDHQASDGDGLVDREPGHSHDEHLMEHLLRVT
jgi:ZIP family zinc transporter